MPLGRIALCSVKGIVKIIEYEKEVTGNGYIDLTDAVVNKLLELKAYGGCTQASTPTPTTPVDIVCNNGALKIKDKELPVGYKRLSYIESSGAQIIDTNYVLQETDTVEVDYNITNRSRTGDKFLLGAQPIADNPNIGMWVENYGTTNSWYVRFGSLSSANVGSVSSQLSGTFKLSKMSFVVNGVEILQPAYNAMLPTPLSIFNRRNLSGAVSTAGCSAQISEVRIVNNGNVIRKYISCKSPDNILGLYEVTQGEFLDNNGSGDFTAGAEDYSNIEVYVDGTKEKVGYSGGATATCEDLLGVGDYKDEQEILSGNVITKVGVMVLEGTEAWKVTSIAGLFYLQNAFEAQLPSDCFCTHFLGVSSTVSGVDMPDLSIRCGAQNYTDRLYIRYNSMSDASDLKTFLASQLAAGTPVIVVYPLATPTTLSVAGQSLSIPAGNSRIEIVEGSILNLPLYAKYKSTSEE